MLHTRLCDLLGIQFPIIVAPMGPNITDIDLAAAVSNAGGLGLISFGAYTPLQLRERVALLRELTDKPFGVNFILEFPVQDHVAVCIEEKVPILSFFWGDPSEYVGPAHDAGLKVFDQIGTVKAAAHSAQAGVDVIIAQGLEAGGHVAGTVATSVIVPRVVDAVAPTPVVAAGGIADARGVVAALALGAEGVVVGTRFIATNESNAHPIYKRKVVEANVEDTVYTTLYGHGWPNAPHRTLRTGFVDEWLSQEARGSEQRADEPAVGETILGGEKTPVLRFMGFPPSTDATGDIEAMGLMAGQCAGLVDKIKPAGEVVRDLVEGAEKLIAGRLNSIVNG